MQEYVLPDFSPTSSSRTGYIRSGPDAQIPNPETVEANGKSQGGAGVKGDSSNDNSNKRGAEVLEEEQVLIMGNERFAGPELLFNPSDIGTPCPMSFQGASGYWAFGTCNRSRSSSM